MKIQILREEIKIELTYLDSTIKSIIELRNLIADAQPDVFQKAAMSQFIIEYYNGIENILKRICKYHNISLPYGDDSHIRLFNLFTEGNTNQLPIIFDNVIANEFKQIRKFRHFAVHGYSFKIDWKFLKNSIYSIEHYYQLAKKNILNYIKSHDLKA